MIEFPQIICIYCIECSTEKGRKRYIGQTTNLYSRFLIHTQSLKRNSHTNYLLQDDYNKYGENKFLFYVLEHCSPNALDSRERHWIKFLNTFHDREKGYNLDCGGIGGGYDKEYFKRKRDVFEYFQREEKKNVLDLINQYKSKKFLGTDIQEFKDKLFNCIKTIKETNYRHMGIRAVNGLLKEMDVEYSVYSGTISIKNKNNTYWIIEND